MGLGRLPSRDRGPDAGRRQSPPEVPIGTSVADLRGRPLPEVELRSDLAPRICSLDRWSLTMLHVIHAALGVPLAKSFDTLAPIVDGSLLGCVPAMGLLATAATKKLAPR